MTCINCGKRAEMNYCSHCGQPTHVKSTTFREGWNDFWARIYGFDGMFPRTLKDLTIRPGVAAKKYIEGNRVMYYGPVGYFFLMITLFLLTMSILGVDVRDFMVENQRMLTPNNPGAGQLKFEQAIFAFVSENLKLIAFVVIPFNGVVARYVLFRKSGFNFFEHLVIPFYVAGHVYWVAIVSVMLYKATGSTLLYRLNSLILFFYLGLAYSQLMNYQPKWKAFTKGILVQIIGMFFTMILALLIIFILTQVSPEFYEMIRPKNN